jgi:hypothetical protein
VPARGLIIAIESYSQTADIVQKLEGTIESAKTFHDWLTSKQPKLETIVVCSDDPTFPGRTHGATAQDIRNAIRDLHAQGAGSGMGTEELFVFVSGHGFLFEGPGRRAADVIVGADFTSPAVGGASCLPLDGIQHELRRALGPGRHYYFIDACRNLISADDIEVGPLGVRLAKSSQSEPRVYTLFSTSRLAVAPDASPFAGHLVEGLRGHGRAKRPIGGNPPLVRVVWESLEEYVRAKHPGTDGQPDSGASAAVLFEAPLTKKKCIITIENAEQDDVFDVSASTSLGAQLASLRITGREGLFTQPPDDYSLRIRHVPSDSGEPSEVLPDELSIDLYEDCPARFTKRDGLESFSIFGSLAGSKGAVPPPPPPATTITVDAPVNAVIHFRDAVSGEVRVISAQTVIPVAPGQPCSIEAFDPEGTLIARRDIVVPANTNTAVDLKYKPTPLRAAIAASVPSSAEQGWLDFSESLDGVVSDPDLGVWLAIMAASRVLGPQRFSKLRDLPLATFDDVPPNGSALYVLAGFDEPRDSFRVGIGTSRGDHRWMTPTPVPGFPGLYELKEHVAPGGLLFSCGDAGKRSSTTISSFALPNRTTVVTVTEGAKGLRLHQLMLPIHVLEAHLHPDVRASLPGRPLRAVKFIAQAQRLLTRRRSLTEAMRLEDQWEFALGGKWVDPMMGIVACYELIREGRSQELVGSGRGNGPAHKAVENLSKYFGELPDTVALRKLCAGADAPIPPPRWPPLFIDGYTAFSEGMMPEPLPEGRLHYADLWTTWRNAVPHPV